MYSEAISVVATTEILIYDKYFSHYLISFTIWFLNWMKQLNNEMRKIAITDQNHKYIEFELSKCIHFERSIVNENRLCIDYFWSHDHSSLPNDQCSLPRNLLTKDKMLLFRIRKSVITKWHISDHELLHNKNVVNNENDSYGRFSQSFHWTLANAFTHPMSSCIYYFCVYQNVLVYFVFI